MQAAERVKAAQQAVVDAERALADAVQESAQRQRDAQQSVRDAERDLRDAQREARDAQQDLTEARRDATRSLAEMNERLQDGQLDQREATLRLKQAQQDLNKILADPKASSLQREQAQLSFDRAKANLAEQRRDYKDLKTDVAAANKAGVDGSEQVRAARERIASADRTVGDRQRALAAARRSADQAAVEGARSVADAQRGLAEAQAGVDKARRDGQRQIANAQRAVAEASAALAAAQAAAAAQTSALDQAMANLAPNARSFVNAIRGLAPAWDGMRLGVQNALFAGLDSRISSLGRSTIPTLKQGLTGTATQLNLMAKSALDAVANLQKTGMLSQILAGANRNLAALRRIPGQMVTAFGQLSVAAQPGFERLLVQAGGFADRISAKLTGAFKSGQLEQAIGTAFDILEQVGGILADAFGAVGNIMKSAASAGGQILGVIGEVVAEIRRITAMPEVQAALKSVFAAVAQIAGAIAPVIGALIKAVMPLLAAIAPVIGDLAAKLGPVLAKLAGELGAALMPIIKALLPVVGLLGDVLVEVVAAVMPLLRPIGKLIASIISALMPVLRPVIGIIVQLVKVLVGPLTMIIKALVPYIGMLGKMFGQIFGALAPLFAPLVQIIGVLAKVFADVFVILVQQAMVALKPLMPVIVELVGLLVRLALQVLAALMPSFKQLIDAWMQMFVAIIPLLPALVKLTAMALKLGIGLLSWLLPPIIKIATFLIAVFAQGLATVIRWVAQLVGWLVSKLGPAFRFFQGIAMAVWGGIKTAISVAWAVLKVIFGAITTAIRAIGAAARWLWVNAIGPAFRGIVTIGKWLAIIIAVLIVGPIVLAFRGLAAVARWLWRVAIGPAFRGIAALGRWLWNTVLKPVWGAMKAGIRALGVVFRWLWRSVVQPAMRGIAWLGRWLWNTVLKPVWNAIKAGLRALGAVFRWLRDKIVRPVWNAIKAVISSVWNKGIKPAFNALKRGVHLVATAFDKAKTAIGKAWNKIKDLTKKPIKWVIDVVYNKGVRGLWNTAASVLPIKKLPAYKPKGFATGGPVNGPGSATSDSIPARLSRGEHVWTAREVQGAGGHGAVESLRTAARGRAFATGGPVPARGGVLGFANGGWFDNTVGALGRGAKAVTGAVGKGLSKLKDAALGGVYKAASAAAKPLRSLINKIPGGTSGWGQLGKAVPTGILNEALAAIKGSEDSEMGGGGSPGVARALKWVKKQAGKPYQWGGAGNPSFDCSGLLSSTQKVIQGKNPKGRLWSTFSFQGKRAPAGWKYHAQSPYKIGITNRGKGHTAGTLAGTKIESRGGDGVVVGSRARGYNSSLFGSNWYGYLPARGGGTSGKSVAAAQATARQMLGEFGWSQKQWPSLKSLWQKESGWRWNADNPSSDAYGIPQALPGRKMRSAGADWKTNPATQIKWGLGYIKHRPDYGSPSRAWSKWKSRSPHWYDAGGWLQPGATMAMNGTGQPEAILTAAQWRDISTAAATSDTGGDLHVSVFVGDREITDIARAEVRRGNGELLTALGARAGR
ncbi:hypothetical protein OHB04_02295 [Streptomyces sp. NBC_01775]|uniref:aggregation-promoting factor C-terminal-like domain-containing protein n=1 Tax=Streptomyces sp. NBC_01775 TaxID=2975939 RepID=UPI002DD8AA9C|nr:hypothetical protein [Streptomyces sp. NBC_01775]WSB74723.1 hypothetical protein OHB04_02295 [Streptomyces sp. NBC_01775]